MRPLVGREIRTIAVALALIAPSLQTSAAPADDWSLERQEDDKQIVAQRLAKLRRAPFDDRQWAALQKALGTHKLRAKLASLLERQPGDVALTILLARAELKAGDPTQAAERLATIEARAGSWADRVFSLRMEALRSAGQADVAIRGVEAKGDAASRDSQRVWWERAYELAEHHPRDALRIAEKLARIDQRPQAQLRVARAATNANDLERADRAYVAAIEKAASNDKDDIVAERSRALLTMGRAAQAAELLWSLLENPSRGSSLVREPRWEQLVDAHRTAQTLPTFITKLTAWVENHPREPAAWHALAQAQDYAGFDSIDAWRRAARLSPSERSVRVDLIRALESKGETQAAIAEYRNLLARDREATGVGIELAARLATMGKRDLALGLAHDIERASQRNPNSLAQLLDFYNLHGETQRALKVAEQLVQLKPRDPDARIALGEQLYQMHRPQEAMRQWAKLPGLARPADRGWARYAEVLIEHGRTTDAAAALRKALARDPRRPEYLRLRALVAEAQRNPGLAYELWDRIRKVSTGDDQRHLRDEARTRMIDLLVGSGMPHRRGTREAAVREAMERLQTGKPWSEAMEAGLFLAELETRSERYDEAAAIYQRMLELKPGDPDLLHGLARAQRRAGNSESAFETLESLLNRDKQRDAELLAEMSEVAFEAGDTKTAVEVATQAAKSDPNRIDALVRLGELHERQGQVESAAHVYQEALSTAPNDVRARVRLAELELRRGNQARSSQLFRSTLDISGPPELLERAGRWTLDLAEASATTDDLFVFAVKRTHVRPEAEEPRMFLLDTLERVQARDVERWLTRGRKTRDNARVQMLRRPLLAALTRGSISVRERAARELADLRLPQTGVPLAEMGANLRPPPQATSAIRTAFHRARLQALRAAGMSNDPDALAILIEVAATDDLLLARQTAAWGLAASGSPQAKPTLLDFLEIDEDPFIQAMGCVGAILQSGPLSGAHVQELGALSRLDRHDLVQRACALAEAAGTGDDRLERYVEQLAGSDPWLGAVSAWRLGRTRTGEKEPLVTSLLRVYIGPPGASRDAAAAALARLLTSQGLPLPVLPPPPSEVGDHWEVALGRWLDQVVAPAHEPLDPSVFRNYTTALQRAIEGAQSGTWAERSAVQRLTAGCGDSMPAQHVCLQPLATKPVALRQAAGKSHRSHAK